MGPFTKTSEIECEVWHNIEHGKETGRYSLILPRDQMGQVCRGPEWFLPDEVFSECSDQAVTGGYVRPRRVRIRAQVIVEVLDDGPREVVAVR